MMYLSDEHGIPKMHQRIPSFFECQTLCPRNVDPAIMLDIRIMPNLVVLSNFVLCSPLAEDVLSDIGFSGLTFSPKL